MQKKKGISLIVLVNTIIVMIILASAVVISLNNNGIIERANSAKESYNANTEKTRLTVAILNGMGDSRKATLNKEIIDAALIKEYGENNFKAYAVGEGFLIVVNELEFLVDKDGKVNDGTKIEYVDTEYAGDLSKGGRYDGTTEETAYRITCVEDLVEWIKKSQSTSANVNIYYTKCIKLENTIDFYSIGSYKDYSAKATDINGNGEIEELITELTTGRGLGSIERFGGIFDGQENYIKNVYMNKTWDKVALFGAYVDNCTIKNLNITGNITGRYYVGGIIGARNTANNCKIVNCNNYATITGRGYVGGIVGSGNSVNNCKNYGNIIGYEDVGGIIGTSGECRNCINYGNVYGTTYAGGIAGGVNASIYNCVNRGNVSGETYVGGIVGQIFRTYVVRNSYNTGSVNGTTNVGGIIGYYDKDWGVNEYSICYNCYNIGEVKGTTNVGLALGYKYGSINYCKNFYYLKETPNKGIGNSNDIEGSVDGIEEEDLKNSSMVTLLNANSGEEEAVWKQDTNNINKGYPILSWE